MKEHYCPVDKTVISYEGECNWCGEKDTITLAELRQTDLYKNVRGKLMKPEMSMKEEALKLADDLLHSEVMVLELEASRMIRRLVEELDRLVGAEPITHGKLTFCKNCGQQDPYTQTKPLSDEEICNLWLENSYGLPLCNIAFEYARAIEERHGIK